ncbi:MAG TPA: hypothetical protein VE222_08160, partial [Nitrospiraceae bacterium]|nr:hypothetical protein [Nitrospiraceae bacterium]
LVFISIRRSARSRPLRISDIIDATPVRRKNMRRTIGRIFLQNNRSRTDVVAEAAVLSNSTRAM